VYTNLREALGLSEDDTSVIIPKPTPNAVPPAAPPTIQHAKRKAADGDEASEPPENGDSKRSKNTTEVSTNVAKTDPAYLHAQAAASYIPFLSTESLLPPKMPTRAEMEEVLLVLRKKALVDEYFGDAMVEG
jgi:pre-mRNA-splicing factor ISY1